MFIKTILNSKGAELIAAAPNDSVAKVANLFKVHGIGFALVMNAMNELVGTVSERDIVQAIALRGDVNGVTVADIMTTNVVVCDIEDSTDLVREIMTEKRSRHVVVMDGEAMVGIVSIGDLIKHSLNECQVDTSMMRDYITGEGYQ